MEPYELTSEMIHEWIRRAYREPNDQTKLDAFRFTRWNMECAYRAGYDAARDRFAVGAKTFWAEFDARARANRFASTLLKRVADIADDFHPSNASESALALEEMRNALNELISDGGPLSAQAGAGGEAQPAAWYRGARTPSSPNGPEEYDVDMQWGDDPPDGKGWLPLFAHPPAAGLDRVTIERCIKVVERHIMAIMFDGEDAGRLALEHRAGNRAFRLVVKELRALIGAPDENAG